MDYQSLRRLAVLIDVFASRYPAWARVTFDELRDDVNRSKCEGESEFVYIGWGVFSIDNRLFVSNAMTLEQSPAKAWTSLEYPDTGTEWLESSGTFSRSILLISIVIVFSDIKQHAYSNNPFPFHELSIIDVFICINTPSWPWVLHIMTFCNGSIFATQEEC